MKNLNEFNNLTIDFSKMTPIEDVRETLILSE